MDLASVVRELPRPWRPMIGSEHLSLLLSDETGGRAEHRRGPHVGAARGARRARRRDGAGARDPLRRPRRLPRGRRGAGARLHGRRRHVRRTAGARAAARRRAVVHAARPGGGPDGHGLRLRGDRLAAEGLGPLVVLDHGARPAPGGPVRAGRGPVAAGRSRCGTSRTSRSSGRARARSSGGCTTSPCARSAPSTSTSWSAVPRPPPPAGSTGCSSTSASSGAPVDFVSTHTYGNAPLDLRATLARHGREDAQIWWTEWGVSPTHFGNANDGVFSAAFLARGMRSAAGRIDALSYWVVSDQFEELGRPPRLLHGGFGLRTVGELRKPRWWALWLLEQLGRDEVAATVSGDGAGSLVEVWASRDDDRVAVALWNGTLDQGLVDGSEVLARTARVVLDGCAGRLVGRAGVADRRGPLEHRGAVVLSRAGSRLADRRAVGDPARGGRARRCRSDRGTRRA